MCRRKKINEMLATGRLKPHQVIDISFLKYRHKEVMGGDKIKLQNRQDNEISPTIKIQIQNYGMVVEW